MQTNEITHVTKYVTHDLPFMTNNMENNILCHYG